MRHKRTYKITVVGCHKEEQAKIGCAALVADLSQRTSDDDACITVEVAHDPENPYDSNALKVSYNGMPLGYVSKSTYMELWEDFSFNTAMTIMATITYLKWADADNQVLQLFDLECTFNK
jgi:hypothetical protein